MILQIIDDFLPQQAFVEIQAQMLGSYFPWYLNHTVVTDHDLDPDFRDRYSRQFGQKFEERYNYQFTHLFLRDGVMHTHLDKLLVPLTDKIAARKMLRIKANINPVADNITPHGLHIDEVMGSDTTAIFYINTNNGMTVFADGTIVNSQANRLVIFDADLAHTGTTCTDEKVRCVINLNYRRSD